MYWTKRLFIMINSFAYGLTNVNRFGYRNTNDLWIPDMSSRSDKQSVEFKTNKYEDISKTDDLEIFYYGAITDTSCIHLTQTLRVMITKAKHQMVSNPQLQPHIPLHIQSHGGALMPSFYVCDYITNSEIPIHTYVDGYCASAASLMSVCGTKRYMTKHSAMLIHQLTSSATGKFNELKTEVGNLKLFMDNVKDIYLENTNLDEQFLDELLKTDIWLDAETCLQYGLVDEIV